MWFNGRDPIWAAALRDDSDCRGRRFYNPAAALPRWLKWPENKPQQLYNLADRDRRAFMRDGASAGAGGPLSGGAYDGDLRHALNVAVAVLIIHLSLRVGLAWRGGKPRPLHDCSIWGFWSNSGTALERLAEVGHGRVRQNRHADAAGETRATGRASGSNRVPSRGPWPKASAARCAGYSGSNWPVFHFTTRCAVADVTEVRRARYAGTSDGVTVRLDVWRMAGGLRFSGHRAAHRERHRSPSRWRVTEGTRERGRRYVGMVIRPRDHAPITKWPIVKATVQAFAPKLACAVGPW